MFWHLLGNLYGNLISIIDLKAPGSYSHQFWFNIFNFIMGETKNLHFYDFGIFEPVAKPQHQLFLSSETPRHLKKSRRIPKCCSQYYFYKSQNFVNQQMTILEKAGAEKSRLSVSDILRILDMGSISS